MAVLTDNQLLHEIAAFAGLAVVLLVVVAIMLACLLDRARRDRK